MAFYDGTNGADTVRTRSYTLEKDGDGVLYENSDVYYGYGGNDAYVATASTVDLSGQFGLFETSSVIYAGSGDDRFVFAPSRDYLGQVDVQFSGEQGSDWAKLDLSPLGPVSVDFTDLGGGGTTTVIAMSHRDGRSAGQVFITPDVERIEVIGSDFADVLVGNRGDDRLDGGAGADLFYETEGDDAYVFDDTGDRVARYEGPNGAVAPGGKDTIWARVGVDLREQLGIENLRLQAGDIDGVGNELANLITGGAGANVIAGGLGIDSLYGKGGADTFRFGEYGQANKDSIWDFGADDRISLDKTVFTGLDADADGVLDAGALTFGYRASGSGPQIVYDTRTGNISYDADGAGTAPAQVIAMIGRNLAFLDSADFILA